MSELITDGKKLQGEAMPKILEAFRKAVIGRRITDAGYYDIDGEAYPCVILDNGDFILAKMDDEGNGPGTLETASETLCQTEPA